MAGAAVLGVVAGTCAGYVVQAGREPDRLPPLSQPALAQARGEGPEPLSAARDRQVKMDGDLRKLLVKRPGGTHEASLGAVDGWLSQAGYADDFTKPGPAFRDLTRQEFRRAAVTGWTEGSSSVEIRLVQFRQEESRSASDAAADGVYWAEKSRDIRSWPIPGTGDGMVYVHDRPEHTGDGSVYQAQACAWRGDVLMEIWADDTEPISPGKIRDLAKRQMERL
ncbi:hypothetical protein [Streptomyces sp. NPDC005573]|uniref:hypothetical protein n=1 Tax=Streptomyces sp. NPDC005573 TaxID=3156890 RepID=UPI0033B68E15